MSHPILPFVDFRGTPKLRFAVLKLMFPRGRVLRNAFEHVDGDFLMRAHHAGGWHGGRSGWPSRSGTDLLTFIAIQFGTSRGVAAAWLLEAATGMAMPPQLEDAIAAAVEDNAGVK
jgi:hypothetical protein